jgi:hypothetical protein
MEKEILITFAIAIIILFLVVFLLFRFKKQPIWKEKVKAKLFELDQLQTSNDYTHLKSALFEIDKLLDYTLKMKKLKGETMGGRLKSSQKLFAWNDYQKIWEAHKTRNRLAHEMNYAPSINELKKHYMTLRSALRKVVP